MVTAAGERRPARNSKKEPTNLALEYALGLLDEGGKVAVLDFLEKKCALSLNSDPRELTRNKVDDALRKVFGSGTKLFMDRFDLYLEAQKKEVFT